MIKHNKDLLECVGDTEALLEAARLLTAEPSRISRFWPSIGQRAP